MDDVAQIKRPALDVVEHAAGRADDQVDARVEGPDLPVDRLAAEGPADRDIGHPCVSFCSSPTICCVSSRVGARMMRLRPAPSRSRASR